MERICRRSVSAAGVEKRARQLGERPAAAESERKRETWTHGSERRSERGMDERKKKREGERERERLDEESRGGKEERRAR
jgi:hypothetical protein